MLDLGRELHDITLAPGVLRGRLIIPGVGDSIPVAFDPENETALVIEDFRALLKLSKQLVQRLTQTRFETIKTEIAREVTDAAFGQSAHAAARADYAQLEHDLAIVEVRFFEGGAVIEFRAARGLPDSRVFCQIDDEAEIEDLSIETKRSIDRA